MLEYFTFIHNIAYVIIFWEFLNLEGHPNSITGSRITAILLNGRILPISGALAVEGLQSTWLPPFGNLLFPTLTHIIMNI